jgi:hypothetical protein
MMLSAFQRIFCGIQVSISFLNLKSFSFMGALVSFLVLTSALTAMEAQAPTGKRRPSIGPYEYVITPFGYFHPTCVKQLSEGDTLRKDEGVIQHADGSFDRLQACMYPHYNSRGEVAPNTGGDPSISHSWIEAECATTLTSWPKYGLMITGLWGLLGVGVTRKRTRPAVRLLIFALYVFMAGLWLSSCSSSTTSASRSFGKLVAYWDVPPAPTSYDGQSLFFFPGMDDSKQKKSILQPVLAWNKDFSQAWGIASWNCCIQGTTYESSPISVNPGDTIFGTIASTCNPGTLSCPSWNIITQDFTSGVSTTLSQSSSDGQTFNEAFGGVVEVSAVFQCSDYPPNGGITFYNVALYDYNFNLISAPSWFLDQDWSGLTPQCNYGGQASATQVTLNYGQP